jgi:hypothetical protein
MTIFLIIYAVCMCACVGAYIYSDRRLRKLRKNHEHLEFFSKIHADEAVKMAEAEQRGDHREALRHFHAASVVHKRAMDLPHPEVLKP